MNQNPWKKISSKTVYSNPWVRLREDEVINPDDSKGVYAVYEIRYAVGIIALDKEDNIFLVGQFRYAVDEYAWEIVEGGAEKGEEPLVAAKRELKEELGLVAKNWIKLGEEIHISNCHTSEKAMVFLATDLEQGNHNRDGSEILTEKKVKIKDVKKMLDNGEIKDALTIIALHRFFNLDRK